MKRTFLVEKSGTVDLSFAGQIVIANVSSRSAVYVLTDEELADVEAIDDLTRRNNVMNAMYRLLPGERRSYNQAVYEVILGVDGAAFVSHTGTKKEPKNGAVLASQN